MDTVEFANNLSQQSYLNGLRTANARITAMQTEMVAQEKRYNQLLKVVSGMLHANQIHQRIVIDCPFHNIKL